MINEIKCNWETGTGQKYTKRQHCSKITEMCCDNIAKLHGLGCTRAGGYRIFLEKGWDLYDTQQSGTQKHGFLGQFRGLFFKKAHLQSSDGSTDLISSQLVLFYFVTVILQHVACCLTSLSCTVWIHPALLKYEFGTWPAQNWLAFICSRYCSRVI